jgi:hypothetical protein
MKKVEIQVGIAIDRSVQEEYIGIYKENGAFPNTPRSLPLFAPSGIIILNTRL